MNNQFENLQKKLENFGAKLSPELSKEFRDILNEFALLHYSFGEAYKLALITLVPSKTQNVQNVGAVAAPFRETVIETDDVGLANLVNTTFSGKAVPTTSSNNSVFKPTKAKDIQSIGIALAKNLELQLKNKTEEKKE